MKIDTYLDKTIEERFVERDKKKRKEHKSSGKLSAGMLNEPLQWQILKVLGVPSKEIDEYVLRKFFRGNQIEDWLISEMPGVVGQQVLVEYKDCIGFADALVNTKDWDNNVGIIPAEVKSASNAKYKRIVTRGEADKGHILQAGYYALGSNTDHFAVIYVASDDLRVTVFVYETKDYKEEIDGIIDRFHSQLKKKTIPVFEPKEKWQESLKYNKYPAWATLTQEEIKVKYNKLKLK